MHKPGVISYWLMIGFAWFLVGIAVSPNNKIFQQGLIGLFWLPVAVACWQARARFSHILLLDRALLGSLALFITWAGLSIFWQVDDDPVRQLKRIMYVLFFLIGLCLVSSLGEGTMKRLMQLAGSGLAVSCAVAIAYQYGMLDYPLQTRMEGTGLLSHPIIGGYVIGLAMIWWYHMPPSNRWLRGGWILGIVAMLLFIMLTQSRGLWAAVSGALVASALIRGGRVVWSLTALIMICAVVGYWQFAPYIISRGTSYRPEILLASLEMVTQRPWLGFGLGSDYEVRVGELLFPHSHNLFAHVALELGIPGLVMWLGVWVCSLRQAWIQRDTVLGSAVLTMLLFSSIALMFDGGNLWNSPRPEWFVTWLPVGLALGLSVRRPTGPSRYARVPAAA